MLSEYYTGNAYGKYMLWCLGRECVVEEKIALVGGLVRRMAVPHATGDTCKTLEVTMITCLLSASITRLKSSRRSPRSPRKTSPIRAPNIISHAPCCETSCCFRMEYFT